MSIVSPTLVSQAEVQAVLEQNRYKVFTPERGIGCCRVYVSILDPAATKVVGKAAKKAGMIWQAKGYYGLRNVLYVGYDNCDGRDLAKATAIIAGLKALGVACAREEMAD